MKEKEVSLNNAFLVWWFIAWRTFLCMIFVGIAMGILTYGAPEGSLLLNLGEWIVVLVGIFVQVFFIRMAINRNYESKSNGSFRLSATEVSVPVPPVMNEQMSQE